MKPAPEEMTLDEETWERAQGGDSAAAAQADGSGTEADAEIAKLAKLTAVKYERERKTAAEKLSVRASILDRLVRAEREKHGLNDDGSKQGRALELPEPELWPESVNGAELLKDISAAIKRYVILADHATSAAALWIIHTYLLDCFLITPRLAIRSPTHRCGKTTLLDVVSRMVLRPLPTANVTAAAVFRVVEKFRPTLLIDEADTFLAEAEELRGIVNSGHRWGGAVVRTVGDDHEPRSFSTYGACAIALIGRLPATLHDRSAVIDLKRRLRSETITSYRSDRTGELDVLARKAARWAADNADRVKATDPEMPAGLFNRDADNWRPLLAIAEVAGEECAKRARKVAEQCCAAAADDETSRLELLLTDIKAIFTEQNTTQLPSADLVEALRKTEGRPWAEYGKSRKPLSQNQLAGLLKPLPVVSENIRVGKRVPKGYVLERFEDAFARYLAPEGASEPLHRYNPDEMGTSEPFQTATRDPNVAARKCEKPNNDGPCSVIAFRKGGNGQNAGMGTESGLSRSRARELADWCVAQGEAERDGIRLDQEAIEADLRLILREEVALPEHVEAEFERIMQLVFAV